MADMDSLIVALVTHTERCNSLLKILQELEYSFLTSDDVMVDRLKREASLLAINGFRESAHKTAEIINDFSV
ncbi:hypothetical protein [uncultured Rothia sp.]|uniref:hypothetical protein n=1 Tax=uncultured Rothia sp. TaxID=316088 RepID=UPI003217F9B4